MYQRVHDARIIECLVASRLVSVIDRNQSSHSSLMAGESYRTPNSFVRCPFASSVFSTSVKSAPVDILKRSCSIRLSSKYRAQIKVYVAERFAENEMKSSVDTDIAHLTELLVTVIIRQITHVHAKKNSNLQL